MCKFLKKFDFRHDNRFLFLVAGGSLKDFLYIALLPFHFDFTRAQIKELNPTPDFLLLTHARKYNT